MKYEIAKSRRWLTYSAARHSALVADGYQRAMAGITAQAWSEIREKYAAQWKSAGIVRRWYMWRTMEAEVRALVAERSMNVSPRSLY